MLCPLLRADLRRIDELEDLFLQAEEEQRREEQWKEVRIGARVRCM